MSNDIQPNREEKYLTKDEAYDIIRTALGNIQSMAYNDGSVFSDKVFKIADEALNKTNVDF